MARYWPLFLMALSGCVDDPGTRASGAPVQGGGPGGGGGGASGGGSGGSPAGAGNSGASGTGGSADASTPRPDGGLEPPPVPAGSCAPGTTATFDEINQRLSDALTATPDSIATAHPVTFRASLGYAPRSAAGFDLIQASTLALNDAELSVLDQHGLVASEREHFPTFFYGYKSIYAADLPLYVTVDSVLDAVHRSYDDILKNFEYSILQPDLKTFLDDVRTGLAAAADLPA